MVKGMCETEWIILSYMVVEWPRVEPTTFVVISCRGEPSARLIASTGAKG